MATDCFVATESRPAVGAASRTPAIPLPMLAPEPERAERARLLGEREEAARTGKARRFGYD